MTRKRSRLVLWICVEIVFIALLLVGSKYDFNISVILSGMAQRKDDGVLTLEVATWAKIIEAFFEWPALFFGAFCLCVISYNLRKKANDTKVLLSVIALDILLVALMFFGWQTTFKDILQSVGTVHYVIMVLLSLFFAVMIKIIVEKLPKKTLTQMLLPALVTAAALLAIFLGIELIKLVWGRVRLREIAAANDITLFTSWFVPNWFSGSKSFPSGHAANITSMLLILIWLKPTTSEKKRNIICAAILTVTVFVAFSRICAGAHYLTDTLFGFIISFIIVQITVIKYEKIVYGGSYPSLSKTTADGGKRKTPREKQLAVKKVSPAADILYSNDNENEWTYQSSYKTMYDTAPGKRATLPAREAQPIRPIRQTSFSLEEALAEQAAREATLAAQADEEAKKLEEGLKLASTGEIRKLADISVPIVPKQEPKKANPKPKKKKSTGKKKAASPQSGLAVQMHFKYDNENKTLTSDISDD